MASGATDLLMPKLGLTMTEGMLTEWRVAVGDRVGAGDVLFVVETDKIANEIEAPGAGVVEAILVPEGETVPVGTPVARWTGPGLPAAEDDTAIEALDARPASRPVSAPAEARIHGGARIVATPLARRHARQANIDLAHVAGSGPGGRIKAADVARATAAEQQPAPNPSLAAGDRLVRPSPIQAIMARRMAAAVREIPHFYLTVEVAAESLMTLRGGMNTDLAPLRLTVGHFVVSAVARALASRPEDNRIWEDGSYRVLAAIDVGVAVATDAGLVAPVLRGIGAMDLFDLAAVHDRLVARARAGELGLDDMTGGAITVSNLGAYGVGQVFPIINPPQSLSLGVGAVQSRSTESAAGDTERGAMLALVLAADHRVFDGAGAAALLARIGAELVHPHRLLRSPPES